MKGITTYLLKIKAYLHKSKKQVSSLESIAVKGEGGGGPLVSGHENEFDYLADRGGHGGHLGEKFVKNIVPSPS